MNNQAKIAYKKLKIKLINKINVIPRRNSTNIFLILTPQIITKGYNERSKKKNLIK